MRKIKNVVSLIVLFSLMLMLPSLALANLEQTENIQSAHPYANNFNNTWSLTKTNAAGVRVHFSQIGTEQCCDRVFTSAGDQWKGTYTDVWSDWVPGNTITIGLQSDSSVTGYGFYVDKSEYCLSCLVNGSGFFNSGFSTSIISNIKYYEDPSIAQKGFSSWTSTARNDFDNITNASIGFSNVSNYESADVRFFAGDYTWATYYGKMQPYATDGSEINLDNDPYGSWYKAHVLYNTYEMNSIDDYDKQKVVVHELGHALGLKHQVLLSESIMEQGQTTSEQRSKADYRHPTALDISNLRWKY